MKAFLSIFILALSAVPGAVSGPLAVRADEAEVKFYSAISVYGKKLFEKHAKSDSSCHTLPDSFRKMIRSYEVKNGCCTFYFDTGCSQHMFTSNNRKDRHELVTSRGKIENLEQ
ncbi:Protein of unknown function [Pyronema omphalodes CBS 100304]|uniref:Uncharacterized protein n=1 Tax=Pyronema omphalodes (strain CBS 100304) TaxID=1076935 RepID=U4LXC4_PYROM|nr:Protein of unknown function [Pyronema omphalodes CBS 100304]